MTKQTTADSAANFTTNLNVKNIDDQNDNKQEKTAIIKKNLPAAAMRALQEAEERRLLKDKQQNTAAKECGGRGGQDPTRYGDWEIKGRAIDF